MKIRQPGEPSDDGYYKQDREIVLRVLKDHEVTVTRIHRRLDSYLLEKDDEFICQILPSMVPAKMVFRLARTFSIPPDKFYGNNNRLN